MSSPIVDALLDALLGQSLASVDPPAADLALDRGAELGIFPLLYDRFTRRELPIDARHRARWRTHLLRVQVHRHEAERALEAIVGAGIEVRTLKGWWLGETIFGDARLRDTSDIDLLVHLGDVDEVVAALRPLGYEPPAAARPAPWANNQFAVYHRGHGLPAEIHWDLAHPGVPGPAAAWWFAGSDDHRLDRERTFLHLCYHHHHHTGFLKGVVDLAAWIDREGERLDLDPIREIIRRHGIGGMIAWPMRAIERLTGYAMPLSEEGGAIVEAWSAWNAAAARAVLARREAIAGSESLAYKTQDILLGHQMAWDLLGASVFDSHTLRLRSALRRALLGPEALAHAAGRDRARPVDYARTVMRPLTLVRKQLRQLLSGDDEDRDDGRDRA